MANWWLDELSHAGDEHLDPAYVAVYEQKAGFDPGPDLELLTSLGCGSDAVLVDLGAGTGAFALAAAQQFARVIAVDISPAMTAALRQRILETGVANVTVVEAGLLSYVHEGAPADVVFTRHVLHKLPDFWKAIALTRISSMLAEEGILRLRDLVYDFQPSDAGEVIAAWLSGAVEDASIGYTKAHLAEHVREQHSTYSSILEPMLERAGFTMLTREYTKGTYGAYVCRRSR